MSARLQMDLRKKSYDMKLEARTQGFIGELFPWRGSYETLGDANDKGYSPRRYTERSTWRNGVKTTQMRYDANGKVLERVVHERDGTQSNADINGVLARNTFDLLTGTLVMLESVQDHKTCAGSFPIFDGKRRFNITLRDDGKETLAPSKYSSFSGPALRCILKVEPVAGFKKKDERRGWMAVQKHTEAHHKLPTLWLAESRPGGAQVVPVRMEIASDYGSVVAHLVDESDK